MTTRNINSSNRPTAGMSTRGRPRTKGSAQIGIAAVDASIDILDVIVAHGTGINLSALSRATGIKPNLLHKYLVSLVKRGLVVQDSFTGQYDLGPYARQLGMAALNRFSEMKRINMAAAEFSARTGLGVAVYVWTDLGPTLIQMEIGTQAFPVSLRIGSALPLLSSATGRVFLAYLPESATRSLVDRERHLQSDNKFSTSLIAREIRSIRKNSIYVTNDAIIPSLAIVGPVLDSHGKLFCTLTALAQRERISPLEKDRIASEMSETARALSAEIFGPKPGAIDAGGRLRTKANGKG